MNTNLKQSMKPVASFIFENTTRDFQVLCLFPGHFDTSEIVKYNNTDGGTDVAISYGNPQHLINSGYNCDQVADDYNVNIVPIKADGTNKYAVKITPKSSRTRYREFLNFVRFSNLRVTKLRITDMTTNGDHEIFNEELEISASAIGKKAGSDFVQLSAHVDPSNFNQNFIDIDLSQQNLLLDETTLAFLRIPGMAKFQIDFTLSEVLK